MKTFELTLFEGHPIIQDGDHTILIDTGNPQTIHSGDRLDFLGKRFEVGTTNMGLTTKKLSEMLGTTITTLMGMDILAKYQVMFDYVGQQVTFGEHIDIADGTCIGIEHYMGIPVVEFTIRKKKTRCFLDSGARLSYLPMSFTQSLHSIEIEKDFYPGYGEFQTRVHKLKTTLDGEAFSVKYGNLPSMLEISLMMANTAGIIGYDFFKQHIVLIDMKTKTLKYRRRERVTQTVSL